MRGNVIIDVLAAVMLAVAVDILADMEIAVVTAGVITLEFIFKVAHTVEILAGVCSAPGAVLQNPRRGGVRIDSWRCESPARERRRFPEEIPRLEPRVSKPGFASV